MRTQEDLLKYTYRPTTSLEKKALFLEETLEKMLNHSDYLFKKIKRLERLKKPTGDLREKLKDLNVGATEVYEKANTIWKQIKLEGKGYERVHTKQS